MARTVQMIDVSLWQASDQRYPPVIPMAWAKARLRGVQGAYIKASEALSADPELKRNNLLAGAENIKRGAYHFFREFAAGVAQAERFLGYTVLFTQDWELPPALDVEVPCSAKELWAFVKYVFDQTGRWCLIYTSPNAWGQVKDSRASLLKTYKQLIAEHCDLWQAQYPYAEYDDGSLIVSLSPVEPWAKLKKPAVIHQYSARNKLGTAYGSNGSKAIDLDLADEAWFDQWPWPGGTQQEDDLQEDELHTRFVCMVNGQNIRSEPSTSKGNATVIGRVNQGQILYPARNMVIKNAGEVWIRFDLGWAAAVHGGRQYLKAVS